MSRITAWLQASDTDPAAKNKRLASRLFWTGLIVRVLYLTIAHTYRFRITEDHFQFGWEMGRIGRALATGYGFADPLRRPHRPHRLEPAALPAPHRRSLSHLRRLHQNLRLGAPHHQQHLLRRHRPAGRRNRPPLLRSSSQREKHRRRKTHRRQHRPLVRMALGPLPRRHAVRRPLDLGHEPHHLLPHRRLRHRAPHPRHRRARTSNPNHRTLGRLRHPLGPHRPLQLLAPADPPHHRLMDAGRRSMETPPRPQPRRSSHRRHPLRRRHRPLGSQKLPRLPRLHPLPR